MTWLDRLEHRLSDWTIPQFPLFLVAANGLIYILGITEPLLYLRLMLDVDAIRSGEVWRLVTFLFVPPFGGPYGQSSLGPIWMVFWLLLLYRYAESLESQWSEFRFQLFYFLGALATLIVAFALNINPDNFWLHTSLFFAFATLFPNMELLLFFIIPVKIKYLAWITAVLMAWQFVTGGLAVQAAIGAALVNYGVFLGPVAVNNVRLYVRRKRFEQKMRSSRPD